MTPEKFLAGALTPNFIGGHFVEGPDGKPVPDGKGGYKWQDQNEWMEQLADAGSSLLVVHNRDPYTTPRIMMNVALANVVLGRYEVAQTMFRSISEVSPNSDMGTRAVGFLAQIKKKGLVP